MKARRKRRDVITFTSMCLEPQYSLWLNRKPPKGLAERLVGTTLDPKPVKLIGGAILNLHPLVEASAALQYGYRAFNLNPEDHAMCARALTELFLYAKSEGAPLGLNNNDLYVLAETARTVMDDPDFKAASEYQTAEMLKHFEAAMTRFKATKA